MGKAELMRCGIDDCGSYTEHKSKTACVYAGGLRQVKKKGKCIFGLTRDSQRDLDTVVLSDPDEELAQAPWMRTADNNGSKPYDRPDFH